MTDFTGIEDPADALGACAMQSLAFASKFNLGVVQVTGYNYPGREHWAVYVRGAASTQDGDGDGESGNGFVIDLTARQFSIKVPARYETDLDTWLDDACEWLGDSLDYKIYATSDSDLPPTLAGAWIREDINPDTYKRENAALTLIGTRRANLVAK